MATSTLTVDNNMKVDESEETSDTHNDIWDDTLLIQAYERAVGLASVKRDSENKDAQSAKTMGGKSEHPDSKASKKSKKGAKPSKNKPQWNVHDSCRTVYSEDGVEYEATIMEIMGKKGTCNVRYIGYDNEEEVELAELKPSHGESARAQQMAEAAACMEEEAQPQNFGDADFTKGKYCPGMGVLPPPPPPHIMNNLPSNETEALSAMLMSWYMSGYHTGYYFGLANSNKNNNLLNSPGKRTKRK